jgi:AAA+ ATPase superfamily predicted ATPase
LNLPIRLGSKADGDEFFDRETEREDLWRYLEGNHIVLSGLRRLGKTSLLQRLAEEADPKGLLARLVDVEGLDSTGAFVEATGRAFPEHTVATHSKAAGELISGWFSRIKKVDLKLPGGFAAAALPAVLLHRTMRRQLLCFSDNPLR